MGKYLGCVERVKPLNGVFYNFKPIAEIKDNSEIKAISLEEAKELLPESKLAQINLGYSYSEKEDNNDTKTMKAMFDDNPVVVFEFDISELSLNYEKSRYALNKRR